MTLKRINSRTKGHAFEREIAKRLTRWFPNAKRGLQSQAKEYCPDIVGTPFYIECKRSKKYLRADKMFLNPSKQSDREWLYEYVKLKSGEWDGDFIFVILVWKQNYQPVKVTLRYNDLLQLRGETKVKELKDNLITIKWQEFAEALDNKYER